MKTIKMIIPVIVLMLLITHITSAQSYKIIINIANSTASLSKKDISALFLKKKTKWDSGTPVTPVDLGSNSKVRESFTQEIHEKSVGAIRSFWQQAAFAGIASAPPEKTTDQEVIDFVKKNPGAIGYVSAATQTNEVKILTVN
jgi:ABC-type phosphate transport system substrate-binding protein